MCAFVSACVYMYTRRNIPFEVICGNSLIKHRNTCSHTQTHTYTHTHTLTHTYPHTRTHTLSPIHTHTHAHTHTHTQTHTHTHAHTHTHTHTRTHTHTHIYTHTHTHIYIHTQHTHAGTQRRRRPTHINPAALLPPQHRHQPPRKSLLHPCRKNRRR